MAFSVDLGNLEKTVERLVSNGRFNSKSEVLREGVRLVEEREKRLDALDALLAKGMEDEQAGRTRSAADVLERLMKKYEALDRDGRE